MLARIFFAQQGIMIYSIRHRLSGIIAGEVSSYVCMIVSLFFLGIGCCRHDQRCLRALHPRQCT